MILIMYYDALKRRKTRINPDRMIFKLSQRECCGREDIERFMALPEAYFDELEFLNRL